MKNLRRVIAIVVTLLIVLPILGLLMMNWLSKAPDLGVKEGRLTDCPSSPNCVSTQASDESHRMEPIPFTGDLTSVRERLKQAIGSMPRSKITEETDNYIRAEFTTPLMRYVDDVELLIDTEANVVHFRSASRMGYSDMGANRKRMIQLAAAFGS